MAGEWNMATIIAVSAVAVILFLAIRYIIREKRKGTHCIGCPMAGHSYGIIPLWEEQLQCVHFSAHKLGEMSA